MSPREGEEHVAEPPERGADEPGGLGGFGLGTLLRLVGGQQRAATRATGPDGEPVPPRFAEAA
ncbi:hypothetical protein, partial [Actinomadura harenae]